MKYLRRSIIQIIKTIILFMETLCIQSNFISWRWSCFRTGDANILEVFCIFIIYAERTVISFLMWFVELVMIVLSPFWRLISDSYIFDLFFEDVKIVGTIVASMFRGTLEEFVIHLIFFNVWSRSPSSWIDVSLTKKWDDQIEYYNTDEVVPLQHLQSLLQILH